MTVVKENFAGLTPEDILTGSVSLDETRFEDEILDRFDSYELAMVESGYPEVLATFGIERPRNLSDFKHKLVQAVGDEHPEWDPHANLEEEGIDVPVLGYALLFKTFDPLVELRQQKLEKDLENLLRGLQQVDILTDHGTKILVSPPQTWTRFRSEMDESSVELEKLEATFNEESSLRCSEACLSISDAYEEKLSAWSSRFSDFLIQSLPTPETYSHFEEIFLQEDFSHPHYFVLTRLPEETVQRLREHGRKLFGIPALEKDLEKKYDITIETEKMGEFSSDIRYSRMDMKELTEKLKQLKAALAMYPPKYGPSQILQGIYLFRRVWQNNPNRKLAGYCSERKIILDDVGVFHHELFHAWDDSDGLVADDAEWCRFVDREGCPVTRVRSQFDNRHPGYASDYAFTETVRRGDHSDDQAELAEMLFEPWPFLSYADDPGPQFARRLEWIKAFYYARTDGLLDETFWQDVQDGQLTIDETYWEKRRRRGLKSPGSEFKKNDWGDRLIQAEPLRTAAISALVRNDYQSAGSHYAELTQLVPDSPEYRVALAQCYKRWFLYEEAIANEEEAVALGADDPELLRDLALLYRIPPGATVPKLGLEASVKGFQNLIKRDIDTPAVRAALAQTYLDQWQAQKAKDVFEGKIRFEDAIGNSTTLWVYHYLRFLRTSPASAFFQNKSELQKIVTFCQPFLRYEKPLGAFYAAIDDIMALDCTLKALSVLQTASATHPEDDYLRYRYILLLEEADQIELAAREAEKAAQDFPTRQEFKDILARHNALLTKR